MFGWMCHHAKLLLLIEAQFVFLLQESLVQLFIILKTWMKWSQRKKAAFTGPCDPKIQLLKLYSDNAVLCVCEWMLTFLYCLHTV